MPLAPIVQKAGKKVYAWAIKGGVDAGAICSNTFLMEWPPGSGKQVEFPEVDKGGWFEIGAAGEKINPGQLGFLEQFHKINQWLFELHQETQDHRNRWTK